MGSNKSGITAKLANTRGIETPQFNDQSARPTVYIQKEIKLRLIKVDSYSFGTQLTLSCLDFISFNIAEFNRPWWFLSYAMFQLYLTETGFRSATVNCLNETTLSLFQNNGLRSTSVEYCNRDRWRIYDTIVY